MGNCVILSRCQAMSSYGQWSFLTYRNCSARSDAFGPKIVSADNLPGTPMMHHGSSEKLNESPLTGDRSGNTKLIVKNELSERRRSLDFVNRPPSPSYFVRGHHHSSTTKINSPPSSPKSDGKYHNNGMDRNGGGEKSYGDGFHSQEALHNGKVPHGVDGDGGGGGGSDANLSSNNGQCKDEKEVRG